MYNTTMIKKMKKPEKKPQNFTDGCTKVVKRVIKYPRLCMMFVHSRTMSIAFINCKKVFFSSQLLHCLYWFLFCIKAIHKTVWCTTHGVFESHNNMKKYKIHTL